MKHRNLHEHPGKKLERALDEAKSAGVASHTRPTGLQHLGNGDIIWEAPELVVNPADPSGPLIPGPSYVTWSVKDVPQIQETLKRDLDEAEARIATARDELDAVQGDIASVVVDVGLLEGVIPALEADTAAALQNATNAAQAASDAHSEATLARSTAEAAEAAANAAQGTLDALADDLAALAEVEHVIFSDTPPPGRVGTMWVNTFNGQPYRWDDVGQSWALVTDDRITAAASAASEAASDAAAAQTAATNAANAAAAADAKATAAQDAADDAQSTADAAQLAAAQAQLAADNAQARADTAQDDAAAAQARADAAWESALSGNLQPNGGFEDDLAHWAPSTRPNTTTTTTTAWKRSGLASLQLYTSITATGNFYATGVEIPAQPGERFKVEGWYRGSPTTTADVLNLIVGFQRSNGSTYWITDLRGSADETTWQRVSATITAPANSVSVRLYPSMLSGAPAEQMVWWDDISIHRIDEVAYAAAQAAQTTADNAQADAATAQAAADAAQVAADAAQTSAANAQNTADAAQTSANSAIAAAGTAQIAADNAASAAAAAHSAANAAQTAADDAASDAATAAGIATAKADVLIQSATPAADMRKASTLWIDTTGNANTPKRWSGSQWAPVTDKAATDAAAAAVAAQGTASAAAAAAAAAQATADDAAAAALDAHIAADAADTKAGQALSSANSRNSRIISLTAATGTVNPTTGYALVEGDSWVRWDNLTDRNVTGYWVWDGNGWRAETLGNDVLDGLDVNKLLVLGTARMTEAVVGKIIGDAAYFNQLKLEDLTVTEGATINYAVVQKMAARQIETGSLRTEVDTETGLYAIMDSFGFRVIDNEGGPEGDPLTLVALGPDGEQLIQLGTEENQVTINSSGHTTTRVLSAKEIWLDGRQMSLEDAFDGPRGIISYGIVFGGYSRDLQARDSVLGLEATLLPGRVYKLATSSVVCSSPAADREPFLALHRTIDGSWPGANWGASTVKESKIGPFEGFRSLPGMDYWIDLTGWDPSGPTVPLRATLTLANYANNGTVRVAAPLDRTTMWVEDWGTSFPNRGRPYMAGGGGGDQPIVQRYTTRFTATALATYIRGGARDESSPRSVGQYSSWNRETAVFFPAMTATLAGATIERIILRSRFTHWYYSSGGTASWCWHGETGIPASSPAKTFMVDTAGWPIGAAREISIIPSEFAAWQSGARRGFIFSTPDTSLTRYGRLSANLSDHYIEVTYTK